ncbi:MAG TPA: sugar phosphate isomerase/epimerase [Spirochaetia bacterium]|nr:sugar phosphate isomerase/epimerase [Spirochaetia bacterium]
MTGGNNVAVQLWTLRKELEIDLEDTLRQIAAIGYAGIELWFPSFPDAHYLARLAEQLDLAIVGAHVPFVDLRDKTEQVMDYHRTLGNKRLVIPFIEPDARRDAEDWRRRVDEILSIAQQVTETGFELAYHNHAFEFESRVEGKTAHDYIFSSIGAELLKAELDTYFLAEVGKDPAACIDQFKSRCHLLHIKDRIANNGGSRNSEIGSGSIDWQAIFQAAARAGVEWFIVEQDCGTQPALESVRLSFDYLKSSGLTDPDRGGDT